MTWRALWGMTHGVSCAYMIKLAFGLKNAQTVADLTQAVKRYGPPFGQAERPRSRE